MLAMGQFDYVELDNAYGDIDFLFFNKKSKTYIYDKIYYPIIKARHVITEKCFYFREYRKAIRGNTQVMRQFLQDIAEVLLSVTTKEGV